MPLQSEAMQMINDNYRHKGLRKKLVQGIRKKGIKNEEVLASLENVPRHLFLDEAFLEFAYEDKAFQIGEGQTISQPYTVAYQTELLEPKPTDTVLEVGTGSAYQACVLSSLVKKIYTIERHQKLYKTAKLTISALGYRNIKCFFGDGFDGLPAFAPFDKILVTAGARDVPQKLKSQLIIGGYMVIPLGGDKLQRMTRIKRTSENEFEKEEFDYFQFVPFLPGKVG